MICLNCKAAIDKKDIRVEDHNGDYHCNECAEKIFPEFNAWGIFTDVEGEIHIRPINEYHTMASDQCECNPTKRIKNGIIVIKHNSFDGREAVEFAKEILNERSE